MPAKVAFAVLNLRKVHACIMELPRSKSVQLAPKRRHTSTTLKVRVENSVRFHFTTITSTKKVMWRPWKLTSDI